MNEQKCWEKCGVKGQYYVHDTSGEFGGRATGIKYPPIDLNNLFKYAVPKLYEEGVVSIEFIKGACDLDFGYSKNDILCIDKDPARALYKACYEALGVEDD